jgi:hypothetical protein
MAIKKIEDQYPASFPKEYIGISSDIKPTVNISVGSTIYETDTKNVYVYNGTSWSLM